MASPHVTVLGNQQQNPVTVAQDPMPGSEGLFGAGANTAPGSQPVGGMVSRGEATEGVAPATYTAMPQTHAAMPQTQGVLPTTAGKTPITSDTTDQTRGLESQLASSHISGSEDNEANIKKLNKIIQGTRTCMLTTQGAQGLQARPMSTAGIDFETGRGEHIYFVTHKDSAKVQDIKHNSEVALVFSNDSNNSWASLTADAEVIGDRIKTKELWHSAYDAYFPAGPEDPNIVLIKATPRRGSFWEGSYATRLHIAFASVKAKLTGKPIDQGRSQESASVVF